MAKLEDQFENKINKSLDSMQSYIDQKFAGMEKMKELQKELEEKQRMIDELKEKGKNYMHSRREFSEAVDDSHSVVTIYRNAVRREGDPIPANKRDSSSSEEAMNISDESRGDVIHEFPQVGSYFKQSGNFISEKEFTERDGRDRSIKCHECNHDYELPNREPD